MLDLVLYHTPNFYTWIVWWYYLAPAAAVIVGGLCSHHGLAGLV